MKGLKFHRDDSEMEFTAKQIERQDELHNAVHLICKLFSEREDLPWSMESIGHIADEICCAILCDKNLGVDKIYYPFSITEPVGGGWNVTRTHIEDYVTKKDFG